MFLFRFFLAFKILSNTVNIDFYLVSFMETTEKYD